MSGEEGLWASLLGLWQNELKPLLAWQSEASMKATN